MSTPGSFERHILNARALLSAYPEKTKGIGMVCCWNEYGEGSYVEPTKLYGLDYLQRIKSIWWEKMINELSTRDNQSKFQTPKNRR